MGPRAFFLGCLTTRPRKEDEGWEGYDISGSCLILLLVGLVRGCFRRRRSARCFYQHIPLARFVADIEEVENEQ